MSVAKLLNEESLNTHVVDILGNIKGRDQPIMLMKKAIELVSTLGRELLIDDDVVFLDPFCKGGEILLACAFARNFYKSQNGKHLVDVQKIQADMFKGNRYFALAPDERHFCLSLRTFLGNEKSHDETFTHIIKNGNYLSETDGKLDQELFKKEFKNMISHIRKHSSGKKIIAVGNPPYQESDGGFGKSASPVYNIFVEELMNNDDISQFVLVIPSRWFSGGKGLTGFRKKILESKQIKFIRTFKDPREIFPTVDINGGVCFISIDKQHNSLCTLIDDDNKVIVDLSSLDAIPDDLLAYQLIEKIKTSCSDFMSEYVLARNPFGITSTTLRKIDSHAVRNLDCLIKERQKIKVPKSMVTKNQTLIKKYKVVVPAAVGGTKAVRDFLPVNQFFIVEPNVVFAETYILIGSFDTLQDAEKLLSFLKTSFCRYFIGLRKLTQHLSQDCWTWVPKMDLKKKWDDPSLFKFFNLSKTEQDHILKKVEEWS